MFTTKRGDARLKLIRSTLRSNMTAPEQLLWRFLRSKQFLDLKFRRQHGVGNYVVDFYCPSKKIAIEVDGDTHVDVGQVQHDLIRDRYLSELGVQVIRYNNSDVMSNVEGVLEDLRRKIFPE